MWLASFVQMLSVQTEVIRLLDQHQIKAVVLKGTSAGIYYPNPYLRMYGDIDILVHPDQYLDAVRVLSDADYYQVTGIEKDVTPFRKNGFEIEIHQRPPGLGRVKEGPYIHSYLLEGLENIQTAALPLPNHTFSMLPWKQNGLELIWHIREHLYNGLGLRQIIDWTMFVNSCLHTNEEYKEFYPVLEKAGLLTLAKTVTRMCLINLGLDEAISWCKDVDSNLCRELMLYLLDQVNFGTKRKDDKAAKVLSRYRNPASFLIGMQQKGLRDWSAAREHAVLRPMAWMYTGIQGLSRYMTSDGMEKLHTNLKENQQRRDLFDQLYSGEQALQNVYNTAPALKLNRLGPAGTVKSGKSSRISRILYTRKNPYRGTGTDPALLRKKQLNAIYESVRKSPLRLPLYHMHNLYFHSRYAAFGAPSISDRDRENVENNVTFIYKSFNRQKQAIQLYHCIKQYYPGARVVIADDSREPLEIPDLHEKDTIIHLPFNVGLSKGLIAALDCVETPYMMRLDDDMLLTPYTNVHEQLAFLQRHPEVDLVGIQAVFRNLESSARRVKSIRMNRRLLIPAGTIIDGKKVVYKPPNIFVARTESVRRVGYDLNIRMIDHHKFFYRAAGQIVCVFDEHSFAMHCHNRFEKEYTLYRSDYRGDLAYIRKKHGKEYG